MGHVQQLGTTCYKGFCAKGDPPQTQSDIPAYFPSPVAAAVAPTLVVVGAVGACVGAFVVVGTGAGAGAGAGTVAGAGALVVAGAGAATGTRAEVKMHKKDYDYFLQC